VREYTKLPIDRTTISLLIETVIHARNAGNHEPWYATMIESDAAQYRPARERPESRRDSKGVPA